MNSELNSSIQAWCLKPTNLWDCKTTKLLVQSEWITLQERFSWNKENYCTAGHILNDPNFIASKIPISTWTNKNQIYLEAPSPNKLLKFYIDNDLSLVDKNSLSSIDAIEKLNDALKFLDSVPSLVDCISQLVRVIGILKSTNLKSDISYSHPTVPFSIFVSICNERSTEASARVAESILHEAMHLRLSLIQKEVKLLKPGSQVQMLHFAPWRQEDRPANGVLHGIFVFRAILNFFRKLVSDTKNYKINEYSERRIDEISSQLLQVQDFYKSPALNTVGTELARHLLNI